MHTYSKVRNIDDKIIIEAMEQIASMITNVYWVMEEEDYMPLAEEGMILGRFFFSLKWPRISRKLWIRVIRIVDTPSLKLKPYSDSSSWRDCIGSSVKLIDISDPESFDEIAKFIVSTKMALYS